MKRLGYAHFVAQGGDWGSPGHQRMARTNASGLLGVHNQFAGSGTPEIGAALASGQAGARRPHEQERACSKTRAPSRWGETWPYFTMMACATASRRVWHGGFPGWPRGMDARASGFAKWNYGADPARSPSRDDVLDDNSRCTG